MIKSEQINEVWVPVLGYEGYYDVSTKGRVRSRDRLRTSTLGNPYKLKGRLLKICLNGRGRPVVRLYKDGLGKTITLHRIMAIAFFGEPNESEMQVNHIDGNKVNNNLNKLEWVTASENVRHAFENGLNSNCGEKNPASILTTNDVVEIRELINVLPMHELADIYGVSKSNIENIKYNRTWKGIGV